MTRVVQSLSCAWLIVAPALCVIGACSIAGEARTVEHAMGVSRVPAEPKRVVVLTNEGTEALLALGVTPVGAVRSWHGDPWYPHIESRMNGVVPVGTEFELEFRALRGLRPDLILANKLRQAASFGELSALAPTVMSDVLYGNWRENLQFYAVVLGRTDRADAVLHAFDQRASMLAARLKPQLADRVSLVRFMPNETWVYCLNSFGGRILQQLGFKRPPRQDIGKFSYVVGIDEIPELDGERLLYFVYETGDGRATRRAQAWTSDPRWLRLHAVRNDKATLVSDSIWTTAGGILAANLLLDDIAALYGVEAP